MRCLWQLYNLRGTCQQCSLASEMAVSAIVVDLGRRILIVLRINCSLMLVQMMAEMLRRFSFFVLAIQGHRCPGELERQQCQQQNEEAFFHAKMITA